MNKKNIEGFAGLDSWPNCRNCDNVKKKYESVFNNAKSLEANCTKYLNLAEQLLNNTIIDNNKKFIEVDNTFKINKYFALKIDTKLFDTIISYNKEIHIVTIGTFDKNKAFLENTPIRISANNDGIRSTIFIDPPSEWNKVKFISSKYDIDYSYKSYINKRNLVTNQISSTIAMKINHKKFIENEYIKKVTFFRNSISNNKKIIDNLKIEIKINTNNMNKSNDDFKTSFDKITLSSIKFTNNYNNLKPINQNLKNQIKILVNKNNLIAFDIKQKMTEVEKLRKININYTIGDTINNSDQNKEIEGFSTDDDYCSTEKIKEGGCDRAILCKDKINSDELKRRVDLIDGFSDRCCQGSMQDSLLNRDRYIMCQFVGKKDNILNKKQSWCESNEYLDSKDNYKNREACLSVIQDNNGVRMPKYDKDSFHCDKNKDFYTQFRGKTSNARLPGCGDITDKLDRKHCSECNSTVENNYKNLGTKNKVNGIDYSSIYVIKSICPNDNTHNNSNDFNGCKWDSNSHYNKPSQDFIDCRCTNNPEYFGDNGWKYSSAKKDICKNFKHIIEYDFPYKTNAKKVNSYGYNFEERKTMIDDFVNKMKQYEDKLSDSIDKLKDLFNYDKNNSYEYKVKHINNLILIDNQYKELINKLQNKLLLIKSSIKENDNKNNIIMKRKINEMIKDDNNIKLIMTNNNELKIVMYNLNYKLKENKRIKKYLSEEFDILKKKNNKLLKIINL